MVSKPVYALLVLVACAPSTIKAAPVLPVFTELAQPPRLGMPPFAPEYMPVLRRGLPHYHGPLVDETGEPGWVHRDNVDLLCEVLRDQAPHPFAGSAPACQKWEPQDWQETECVDGGVVRWPKTWVLREGEQPLLPDAGAPGAENAKTANVLDPRVNTEGERARYWDTWRESMKCLRQSGAGRR